MSSLIVLQKQTTFDKSFLKDMITDRPCRDWTDEDIDWLWNWIIENKLETIEEQGSDTIYKCKLNENEDFMETFTDWVEEAIDNYYYDFKLSRED